MTIKVGDRLPAGSLSEYIEVESAECKIGPNEFKVEDSNARQEGRAVRAARRVYADMLGQARARIRREA